MKNLFKLIILLSITLNADFIKVEMGAGAWSQESTGITKYKDIGTDTYEKKNSTLGYAWILVKHPIPVLPNLRLEYASASAEGKVIGTFKKFNLSNKLSTSKLTMTQFDIIPYYNILDNTFWTTIDLGFSVKAVNISYEVAAVSGFDGYTGDASIVFPSAYARARVEIPFSGLAFEADTKFLDIADIVIYDNRIKLDYTFDITPLIQPAIEIGYRVYKMKFEMDDAQADIDFSGIYAGLMLRF